MNNSLLCLNLVAIIMTAAACVGAAPPQSDDARVRVELFAEHPQIVTPTGLAVDSRGRVFVAESHTHFRPDNYDGPAADRILIFEDTDADGRADKKTIFHEGFRYVMDLEFHHDGSLYVATRKDIHRMRDTNADNRSDEITPIVRLETKGDYPHNGLSGIAFDLKGGFHFGLGENLGEAYQLIGSDGVTLRGGGEGGSTYWIADDGHGLRRVSTGWWNPYGMCTDSFGRVFGTDNDPDASPPCRLIQVVEDGDYGYEFRYGRSGRNPLVAWDGEIPGTLPMIAGTGEAPCHIVAYESDALPDKYFGNLLVPSWADHRVEYYPLEQRSDRGFVSTQRQTLISGGDDFRPVGIDIAPDGTVYVSDWVSSSYALHKQGRIWRVRPDSLPSAERPKDLTVAVQARDRRVREVAGRELLRTVEGRAVLAQQAMHAPLVQSQATCLQLLASIGPVPFAHDIATSKDESVEVRVVAIRAAARSTKTGTIEFDREMPLPLQAEILLVGNDVADVSESILATVFQTHDPLLRHSAVSSLANTLCSDGKSDAPVPAEIPELLALLALERSRATNPQRAEGALEAFLTAADPQVRFAAVKWVADEQVKQFRPQLEKLLSLPDLDLASFLGIHVALLRLDG